MFKAIHEHASVGDTFFDQSLHTFSIGLISRHISLKLYLFIFFDNVDHLKLLFIDEIAFEELQSTYLVLVLFIFDDRLSLSDLVLLFACQFHHLVEQERGVFVNEPEELISTIVFLIFFFDVDAGSITERQDGFTLVIPWVEYIIVIQGKALFSELDQFRFDVLEVTAEANQLLQSGEARQIEQVGLVIDEEVSHLIGFLLQVLSEQNANPVVQAMHQLLQNKYKRNGINKYDYIYSRLYHLFCLRPYVFIGRGIQLLNG